MVKKEEKLTAREKRAVKRRETADKAAVVFGVGKGFGEPEIRPLNYKADLIKALNHYNSAEDNRTKRAWALHYIAKIDRSLVKKLEDLKDYEFSSLGSVCRLVDRGQPLEDNELSFISKRIKELIALADKQSKIIVEEKPTTVKIKAPKKEELNTHVGEIMGMLDDFLKSDKPFDLAAYLKANNVSAAEAKTIPSNFKNTIAELELVLKGTDKVLVEGYSNIGRVKLKKLIEIYKSIETICAQHGVIAKVPRKPRVKKEKPAAKVVSRVKYLTESEELGVKSVHPTTLVGATEVWAFNVKYKKLQVYRAVTGEKLSVKGTTILNYSVEDSKAKTLRRPADVANIGGMTKRSFAQYFNSLKTKDAPVNGRINGDTLIIKAL